MKMRDYEVEIYERHSHGHFGKQHYLGWILNDSSVENVKSFAAEILAGMTYREVFKDCPYLIPGYRFVSIGDGKYRCEKIDADDKIGYEQVEKLFTIKARLFRG